MAATSRKSSKAEVGKHSKAGSKSASKQSGGSQDTRRESQARRASILLRHLSDPTRLEIIMSLAEGEQDVSTLCFHLSQSQPSVSHHLALLRHGGIIAARRKGPKNFYELTDEGCTLAGVAQILLDEDAPERSAARPRPNPASSPFIRAPRPARKNSIGSPGSPALRSDGHDGAEEEPWGRMNRRRAELIFKKNRGDLQDAERSELEQLQTLSRSRMQREFPGPTLIDEKLKRIEEGLLADGVEEA